MENIIYGLYCPKINKPVYVGKSTKGLDRPFEHIVDKSHNLKVKEWVSSLKEEGLSPILVVLEHCDLDSELNDKEKYWITKKLSQGNIMFNLASVTPAYFKVREYDQINSDILKNVAMFARAKRKLLGLTQVEFAQKSGLGLRFIREIETCKKNNFSIKHIEYLLNFLGGKLSVS
jgi:hypothetical protein